MGRKRSILFTLEGFNPLMTQYPVTRRVLAGPEPHAEGRGLGNASGAQNTGLPFTSTHDLSSRSIHGFLNGPSLGSFWEDEGVWWGYYGPFLSLVHPSASIKAMGNILVEYKSLNFRGLSKSRVWSCIIVVNFLSFQIFDIMLKNTRNNLVYYFIEKHYKM